MRAAALSCAAVALAGCTHVQVLPVFNPDTLDVECCVAYAEIPPSTNLSAKVTHSDEKGTEVKLGAKWRF
jgi:hypothetical protein